MLMHLNPALPGPLPLVVMPLLAQGWQHHQRGEWDAAAGCYRKLLQKIPDHADTIHLLAMVRESQGRIEDALRLYRSAADRKPEDAKIWYNLALLLGAQERIADAVRAMEHAVAFPSAPSDALHMLFQYRRKIADWRDFEALTARLSATHDPHQAAAPPFFTFWLDDPQLQRLAAERASARFVPAPRRPPAARNPDRRIRIGYLGADFRSHPTARLLAPVLEHHDYERFEIIVLSTGYDDTSPERHRIMGAGGHFIDLALLPPSAQIARVAALELDILVDLMGHTSGARPDIIAARPAAVQVALLGFPGTSGSAGLDYLIADHVTAPPEMSHHFTEHLVYLPDSYQPNDALYDLGPAPARCEAGLPPEGIVFCSFNGMEKLDPDLFSEWMRILTAAPASVLWLMAGDDARQNLRSEAAARGIDPARLIFAARVPHAAHMARLALADIALDTFPCTGHTTTSDMIRAGVPVVTRKGTTFAARVATSLLHACGLDDLVAPDAAGYEARAIHLAMDDAYRRQIRAQVAQARDGSTLFKADLYTRHLERAFAMMMARHEAGEEPGAFAVPGIPAGRTA